jgi:hypothetical protein
MKWLFLPSWSRAEVYGVVTFSMSGLPLWGMVIGALAWVFACGIAQGMVERRP